MINPFPMFLVSYVGVLCIHTFFADRFQTFMLAFINVKLIFNSHALNFNLFAVFFLVHIPSHYVLVHFFFASCSRSLSRTCIDRQGSYNESIFHLVLVSFFIDRIPVLHSVGDRLVTQKQVTINRYQRQTKHGVIHM